jgi:hypothetical protein
MSQPEAIATIRLTNDEDGMHEVPADVLVQALAGMQQLVYLLGAVQEQRTIGVRFRLSQEIQQRYSLNCRISQPGSYAVPIALGTRERDESLFTNYLNLFGFIPRPLGRNTSRGLPRGFIPLILLGNIENLLGAIQQGSLEPL